MSANLFTNLIPSRLRLPLIQLSANYVKNCAKKDNMILPRPLLEHFYNGTVQTSAKPNRNQAPPASGVPAAYKIKKRGKRCRKR